MTKAFDYVSLLAEGSDDFQAGFPAERWTLPEQASLIPDGRSGDGFVEFLYRERVPGKPGRKVPSPRPMLAQFAEIARGDEPEDSNRVTLSDPDLLLAFARRYGSLGICGRHNVSCWHVVPPCPSPFERKAGYWRVRERLSAWLTYSRLARAILNLVAKPQAPGRGSDFKRLDYFFERPVPGPATAVNYWLSVCRVALRLHGEPPRLSLFPCPAGLAQLGIQIALVVTGRRAIALCDGCGKMFDVKHQPRRDRMRYCPNCGIKAAWRDAQRRHRAKGA